MEHYGKHFAMQPESANHTLKVKFTEQFLVVISMQYARILKTVCVFVFPEHNATVVTGIKGLASGVFFDNLGNSFLEVRTIGLRHTYTNDIIHIESTSEYRIFKFNCGMAFRSIPEIPIHCIRKRST